MSDATPEPYPGFNATATANAIAHEATWSYWETVESTDLTEIAIAESTDVAELEGTPAHPIEPRLDAAVWSGFATMQATDPLIQAMSTETQVAYQLPNTGSGDTLAEPVTALLFVVFAMAMTIVTVAARLNRNGNDDAES
jgi:hypothetical protein